MCRSCEQRQIAGLRELSVQLRWNNNDGNKLFSTYLPTGRTKVKQFMALMFYIASVKITVSLPPERLKRILCTRRKRHYRGINHAQAAGPPKFWTEFGVVVGQRRKHVGTRYQSKVLSATGARGGPRTTGASSFRAIIAQLPGGI